MSDVPQGPGWWEASDGKWYAPELHPDHRPADPAPTAPDPGPPKPAPGFESYEPPAFDARVGSTPPPLDPYGQPAQRYPVAPAKKRSTGKILAIIFGGVFLLLAGGCGVFLWAFRDQIADATIDFSEAVASDDTASCQVTGVDFGDDYEIDAELTATADVESHYRIGFRIVGPGGTVLGVDQAVFRGMQPGETRTEDVFNVIDAVEPVGDVSCEVTEVERVDA